MDLINYWYGNNVTQILTTVNLYIHTTYNQIVSYYAPQVYHPKIVKILWGGHLARQIYTN
jgi:hypothetical protein